MYAAGWAAFTRQDQHLQQHLHLRWLLRKHLLCIPFPTNSQRLRMVPAPPCPLLRCDDAGRLQQITVDSMGREMKIKFLKVLANTASS